MFVQNHTGSVNSLFQKFTGGYRYGFNGKEKDNDVAGPGNTYDYGFRIYNAQLGRFLSKDPLSGAFPWWSPYHFAGNCPIQFIDLDGMETLLPLFGAGELMIAGSNDVLISDAVKPIIESPVVRNIGKYSSESATKYEQVSTRSLQEVRQSFKNGMEEVTKSTKEIGKEQHKFNKNYHKGNGASGADEAIDGTRLRPDSWYKWFDGKTWKGLVNELKPHNLEGLNRAATQLSKYVSELSRTNPEVENWTQIIETYSFAPCITGAGGTFAHTYDVVYKIQKGDNLSKIAQKFNTTVDDIVKQNSIADPNKIEAGATIKVKEFKESVTYK